jgi:hypothetical protein
MNVAEPPLISSEALASPPKESARPNKTTVAAVAYLNAEANSAAQKRAFNALIGICWKAKGPLFIPGDVTAITRPDGESEDTEFTATREWIQTFLLEFFAPYRNAEPEKVLALAKRNAFRYIGRLCKLRMTDEVRKPYKQKRKRTLLDERPMARDGERVLTVLDTVAQEPQDGARSSLGQRPAITVVELAKTLQKHRSALEQVLGDKLFTALKVECLALAEGMTTGEVTAEIGKRLHIKDRQATTYGTKLQAAMAEAVQQGNPAAVAVRDLLARAVYSSVIQKPFATRHGDDVSSDDEPMAEAVTLETAQSGPEPDETPLVRCRVRGDQRDEEISEETADFENTDE